MSRSRLNRRKRGVEAGFAVDFRLQNTKAIPKDGFVFAVEQRLPGRLIVVSHYWFGGLFFDRCFGSGLDEVA